MGKMMFEFLEMWSWVLSLSATAVLGWIWWSIKAKFATRDDFETLETSVSGMKGEMMQRITRLEGVLEAIPNRSDYNRLADQLSGIAQSTHRTEGSIHQIQRFVELLTQAQIAKDGK